jgi:hypothetical protein
MGHARSAWCTQGEATATRSGPDPGQPFRSVEDAWFWTMASLRARHDGLRNRRAGGTKRPCQPDDVIKCLDVLYRRGRIDLSHGRILKIWGERGLAPSASYHCEREEARLWNEAMGQLAWPLRVKGILVGSSGQQ